MTSDIPATALTLPDDILHLICVELRHREDWGTLFNSAVSSKRLAPLALSNLYRFVTSSRNPNACPKCLRDLFWDSYNWCWIPSWEWAPSWGWDIVHWRRCVLHTKPGETRNDEHAAALLERERLLSTSLLNRMQKSPGSDEEAEGAVPYASEQELLVQRWSILWRSICLSSMDKTMYPYHQYLRSLDLRDLENMLDDDKFGGKIERNFFAEPLARLHHQKRVPIRGRNFIRLDLLPILEDVGSLLVSKTQLLEQVSGKLSSGAFLKWVPNMPRLKRLELYHGEVLADQEVHKAIYEHCPQFEALSIFQWLGSESDHQLGSFIGGLPNQMLKDLTTYSACGVAMETCLALNNHGKSLRKLELNFGPDAVPALALLKECTSVESLHLEIPGSVDLENTHKEVFLELINWLGECRNLREITLTEFKSGPAVLTPLLLSDVVHLEEVSLNAHNSLYSVKDNREFHKALSHQKTLQTLCLRGDAEEVVRDDIDAIIDSVCQLSNLKKLELRGVADYFSDAELIRTLTPLSELEEVYIGGYGVSDAVLSTVSSLKKLRAMNFVAITSFTCDGLLEFVDALGPGNDALHVSVDNADPQSLMTDEEVALVREALAAKVGGRLDYIPLRGKLTLEIEADVVMMLTSADPNISEYEDSDSD